MGGQYSPCVSGDYTVLFYLWGRRLKEPSIKKKNHMINKTMPYHNPFLLWVYSGLDNVYCIHWYNFKKLVIKSKDRVTVLERNNITRSVVNSKAYRASYGQSLQNTI
jgi:hypothetical protein